MLDPGNIDNFMPPSIMYFRPKICCVSGNATDPVFFVYLVLMCGNWLRGSVGYEFTYHDRRHLISAMLIYLVFHDLKLIN